MIPNNINEQPYMDFYGIHAGLVIIGWLESEADFQGLA